MNEGADATQHDFVLIKLLQFRSQQQLISLKVHEKNLHLMLTKAAKKRTRMAPKGS